MKINQIKAVHIQIPLRVKFSQSNNATKFSDSIILEVISSKGNSGFGESCPRLYVTGEDWQSVYKDFQVVDAIIKEKEFESIEDIKSFVLRDLYPKIGPASLCAIELALLDVFGKENNINLARYFGMEKAPEHSYSGVIPLMDIEKLGIFLEKRLGLFNFSSFKLKIGNNLNDSLEKIDLIFAALGKDISLRVDANCSWVYQDAVEQIPAFIDKGINSFEQIFPKGNENEMGKVTKEFGSIARIMADESNTTYESAKYLVENELCNFFNFKISKNGGIFNALRIYDYIMENGAGGQLGAHFGETSILTMAGILFASKSTELSNYEGGLGHYLLEADVCRPSLTIDQNGQIGKSFNQLGGKGLGLELDQDLLFKYSI